MDDCKLCEDRVCNLPTRTEFENERLERHLTEKEYIAKAEDCPHSLFYKPKCPDKVKRED